MGAWLIYIDMFDILKINNILASMLSDALDELNSMRFLRRGIKLSSIFSNILNINEKHAVIIDIIDTHFERN